MALLRDTGIVADRFVAVGDDEPLPAGTPVLVSLERWRAERQTLLGRNTEIGVRLKSEQPAEEIAADLDRIALVAVEFFKYRDGRGFSTARELRERFNYQGEIRAFGHVIADQYAFLRRCGFNSVEIADAAKVDTWVAALDKITIAYQPDFDSERGTSLLRRHLPQRAGGR
jgi:uncharacterized protein (DUF934 family)